MPSKCLKICAPAVRSLIRNARKGYEEPYKREVGGHLLGYRRGRDYVVTTVVPYNTPYRSRSVWDPNTSHFVRKGYRLERGRRLWLGAYHSHVEIGGSASTSPSPVDTTAHLSSNCPIEVIIRVVNYRMRRPANCLSLEERFPGDRVYYYDICAYMKDSGGRIRRIRTGMK